jgi:predicted dehydrogenase
MFLFHPQHEAIRQLIRGGAIGQPLHVDAWFGFPDLPAEDFRRSLALGGGALNDAGGYPLHAARFLLEGEPLEVAGRLYRAAPDAVDHRGTAWLEFPGDRSANATFGFGLGYRNAYAIWGADGLIQLERAFSVPPDFQPTIVVRDRNGREERRQLGPANQFALALEAFAATVRGERPFDAFLGDFLAISRILDRLRRCDGMTPPPAPPPRGEGTKPPLFAGEGEGGGV